MVYNTFMENAIATKAIFRDKKRRVWELDFLRGIAVIAMCFDHLMFDFYAIQFWFSNWFKVDNAVIRELSALAEAYWYSTFRFYAHFIFVFLFLFLVGTSCAFSRDNVRRGSALAVVSLAFTGVTLGLIPMGLMEQGVIFGILHCIALSILCAAAVDTASKRIRLLNVYLPLLLGVAICAVGIGRRFWLVYDYYDEVFDAAHLLDYILGGISYGDDWFGLFPNVGAVLIGMYFGKAAYQTRSSLIPRLGGKWSKPVGFVGRHALLFYLGHQVILTGAVTLLCLCLGYRF